MQDHGLTHLASNDADFDRVPDHPLHTGLTHIKLGMV
jgi:hypothetical protein